MALEIPSSADKAIASFIRFSPEKVASFASALAEASPSLVVEDLAGEVADRAKISKEEILPILEVFAAMHASRNSVNKGVDEFVEDVRKALIKKNNQDLIPSSWSSFATDLAKILSAEMSLGVTTKAIDVMTEHEHVFQHARIMTDVRPIFAMDPHKRPSSAVIIHVLNLFYRDLDGRKQVCFALDSRDLKQLKEIVQRAEAKEETLKSALGSSGFSFLEQK